MKLSRAQQELLDAMKNGVKIYFMLGLTAHHFRSDHARISSASVWALERHGLIKERNRDWRGCEYELTELD